jgi:hypothetical protein
MNRRLQNRFLGNYVLMFIISIMIALFALLLLGFANDVISKTLVQNNYTAKGIMQDNYKSINTKSVIDNGGGVQVINTKYEVVFSEGINTIHKDKLIYERRNRCYITIFDKFEFIYDFDIPEIEIFAEIDVKQMDRVFQNLVSNTLKYNPKGTKITISVSEQGDGIVIIFKDNGIGIPKEIAKDIFNPFVRVDSARNSQTGGTGLGLAIALKIIVEHCGNMRLKTEVNCGCEFIINIPRITEPKVMM